MTGDPALTLRPEREPDPRSTGLGDPPPQVTRLAIGLILLAALALRVWHLSAGVPFAVGVDEPHIINRALAILRTGDWNTHAFDYPTLVIYLNAIAAIPWFLWGASRGLWSSLVTIDVGALYAFERCVAALIGVWTVWLVFRLGKEVDSAWVGLVAAAQLATLSLHVRESHFVLTDVPTTALMTLTILLSVRAGRLRTDWSFAWAGAAAGLSGAAKYNGGVVLVAPLIVWAGCAWCLRHRSRALAVVLLSAAAAFVIGNPYSILDLPGFLNGYGAQMGRFTARRWTAGSDPAWLVYYKHLARPLLGWIPLAFAGAALAIVRRPSRPAWAAIIGVAAAYWYALASHSLVFARYALPLLPIVALGAAVSIVEMGRRMARLPRETVQRLAPWAVTIVATAIASTFAMQSIEWLGTLNRVDTRTITARWMRAHAPAGAKVAVEETSGPANLETAGFRPEFIGRLDEHPLEWYAVGEFDYLVISTGSLEREASVFPSAPTVFTVAPDSDHPGPAIRIVSAPRGPERP
jgi:4-amino-4-deoxy-L-arabinose transferase-like glycosyltransferase